MYLHDMKTSRKLGLPHYCELQFIIHYPDENNDAENNTSCDINILLLLYVTVYCRTEDRLYDDFLNYYRTIL